MKPVLSVLLAVALLTSCAALPAHSGRNASDGSVTNNLDTRRLERRIHDLVNDQRRSRSLSTLDWSGRLSGIAANHSTDMGRRRFFSHVNPGGENPTTRARKSGFECRKEVGSRIYSGVAENIAETWTYSRWTSTTTSEGRTVRNYEWRTLEQLARETVTGWMNSPGHRANIMNRIYQEEGIGVAVTGEGRVLITQNFC